MQHIILSHHQHAGQWHATETLITVSYEFKNYQRIFVNFLFSDYVFARIMNFWVMADMPAALKAYKWLIYIMIYHTLQQSTWLCTKCSIYLFNFIEWEKMRDWHKMKSPTPWTQSLRIWAVFAYSSSVIWPCMCVCVWENGLKPFSVGRFLVHGCYLSRVWNSLHIFVLKNLAPYMGAQIMGMPIYALYDPSVQSVQTLNNNNVPCFLAV